MPHRALSLHGRVGLDNPATRHCWQDWHVTEFGKQVDESMSSSHKVLDLGKAHHTK